MPRNSPYQIILTKEEDQRLQEIARKYTSPYCDVVRAKAVLLAAQGLSNKEIGRKLDLPREVASKWRKRFFEERLDGLQDRSRPGRPSRFSPSGGGPGESSGL